MKKRKGFVSNSSSSSFICDVCGMDGCGFDACPSDFDMAECECGHTFCYDHAVDIESPCTIDMGNGASITYENMFEVEHAEGEVPSQYCPICMYQSLSSQDYKRYLKKTGRGMDEIFKEIKERFSTYKEFSDFLRSKD